MAQTMIVTVILENGHGHKIMIDPHLPIKQQILNRIKKTEAEVWMHVCRGKSLDRCPNIEKNIMIDLIVRS